MSVRRSASGRAHYNYFRDYDSAIGRYIQSDPIGLFGGAHSTFVYAYDDPAEFIDPTGLRRPGGAIAFRDAIRDMFFGGWFPTKEMRSDGYPQGWGCADKFWDPYIPDIYFKSCRKHDDCYDAQLGKNYCDCQFLKDAREERPGGWATRWGYYGGLHYGGGPAYSRVTEEKRQEAPVKKP